MVTGSLMWCPVKIAAVKSPVRGCSDQNQFPPCITMHDYWNSWLTFKDFQSCYIHFVLFWIIMFQLYWLQYVIFDVFLLICCLWNVNVFLQWQMSFEICLFTHYKRTHVYSILKCMTYIPYLNIWHKFHTEVYDLCCILKRMTVTWTVFALLHLI